MWNGKDFSPLIFPFSNPYFSELSYPRNPQNVQPLVVTLSKKQPNPLVKMRSHPEIINPLMKMRPHLVAHPH